MYKNKIKIIRYLTFLFLQMFVLQIYDLLFSNFLKVFLMFEVRKNLDLRKILGATKIFLKSRFPCTGQSESLTTLSTMGSKLFEVAIEFCVYTAS